MRSKIRNISFLLFLTFTLVACANSFIKSSFDTLSVSKATYDSTLNVAGDLYKQGLMSEEQKTEAIKIGNVYMVTHNEAVNALLNYKMLATDQNKDIYLKSAADVSARLADLLEYLKPIILKEEN